MVLAGEPPAPERRPGQEPEALGLAGRDDFPLDLAHEEVVLGLQGDRTGEPAKLGYVDDLLYLPAREVGEPYIVDFPRPHGVVQRPQRLFEGGERVVGVDLVQVDAFDAEAAERGIDRPA